MARKDQHIDRDGVGEGSGQSGFGPRRNLFLRRLAVSKAREQRYVAMYHDGQEAARSKLKGPGAKLVKRQRKRYSFIGVLILLSYHVFVQVSRSQHWFGDDWLGVWTAGVVILTVAIIFWVMAIDHRLKNRVIAANNRICPNCGYSLVGHDTEGICPECGDAFSPTSLETAWRGLRKGL